MAEGLNGRIVAVVDDDELIRALTARVLTREGATVILAGSLAAFRAFADRVPLDCVVMDLLLTNGNGLAEMRRRHGTPCVLCSGYDLARTPLEPGWVVLEKPFAHESLVSAILESFGRERPAPPEPSSQC